MMEISGNREGMATEDFTGLLKRHGALGEPLTYDGGPTRGPGLPQTEATTILAFKFKGGVLMAGDRRATAGNVVVYDRADKVLEIDRLSVMAIAGVPATAWEMARMLEHSFQFYRRSQLQEMSLDGKVRALSKLLRDNFGNVVQGIGAVIPLFATYDEAKRQPRLYFYDAMGAQFEATDYAVSGSGSPAVRSVLYYANTYGPRPLVRMNEEDALLLALRALDTAAESDTATGGVDRHGRVYPVVKIVSQSGVVTLPERILIKAYQRNLVSLPKHTPKFSELE
ncbi:MAG TPA: proteasome subunit alpha [Chthoniobacteraceae bacterium]|nr:proteasome subunit alpha [Chthoniobacteraceae bacterium]